MRSAFSVLHIFLSPISDFISCFVFGGGHGHQGVRFRNPVRDPLVPMEGKWKLHTGSGEFTHSRACPLFVQLLAPLNFLCSIKIAFYSGCYLVAEICTYMSELLGYFSVYYPVVVPMPCLNSSFWCFGLSNSVCAGKCFCVCGWGGARNQQQDVSYEYMALQ